MDRQQVFPGAVPLETDILNSERNTMVAIAKLAAGVLGTSGFINGLTVAPNSPAALNVVVSPGEFYSLQNLDGTAYSSLPADTTHQLLKQGILLDAVTLATAAPGTAGQSVVYLIQASVSESDTTPVVLPYYNASNPALAYSGPANAGTTNNTKRQCVITLQAKAGISAATGSQTTPAPDAGFTGLYAVTVANSQSTVVASSIAVLTTAPYFGSAALVNQANVFTQAQSAPAPVQYDNTAKLVNSAYVRGELLGLGNTTYSAIFGHTLAASGYQKLPGGLILQWGSISVTSTGVTAVLPISFPTAVLTANITHYGTSPANVGGLSVTWTSTQITGYSGNAGPFLACYQALGY